MTATHKRVSALFLLSAVAIVGNQIAGTNPVFSAADATSPATSKQDKKDLDDKTILALIKELGDDAFEKREAADKRLAEIGERALQLLEKAAKDDPDAEVRQRAQQLARNVTLAFFKQVNLFKGHGAAGKPWVTRVAVTPDGSQAVSSGGDGLRLWDLKAGKEILVFGQPKNATYCWSLAISLDAKRLIVGGDSSKTRIFDIKTGNVLQELVGHTASVWGVALLGDGKQAITGAWDQSIRVWDLDSGKTLRTFEGVHDNVRCLAVSPDGKLVAAGHFAVKEGPATVRIWDLKTGKEVRSCEGHTLEITAIGFSPDGKTIVSGSYDRTVRIWDVATGNLLKTLTGHISRVEGAAFTSDGKRVVSCADQNDRTVRIWDAASGKQIFVSEQVTGGFISLAVLRDGNQCVTAGKDSAVRLWHWVR